MCLWSKHSELDCNVIYCGKISVLPPWITYHLVFQISHDTTFSTFFSFFFKRAVSAKTNALFVNRKLIPTYGLQVDTQQPWSKLWAKSESLYIQLVALLFLLDL